MQESNLKEDFPLCQSEHLTGLLLSFRNTLNAAAIDFGKIARIIQDKSNAARNGAAALAGTPDVVAHNKTGEIINYHNLNHEGRASDYPHNRFNKTRQGLEAGH